METPRIPRIVTYGEILQIMENKKKNQNKYRIKVSYGSPNKENDYRFSLSEAIKDKR